MASAINWGLSSQSPPEGSVMKWNVGSYHTPLHLLLPLLPSFLCLSGAAMITTLMNLEQGEGVSVGVGGWCCVCSVAQSRPTLLRPHGLYLTPGSSVRGISQARILE